MTVDAYEAKTHLPALLARVEAGETVSIARHRHSIAKLLRVGKGRIGNEAWQALLAARSTTTVLNAGETLKDLAHDGHRI